MNLINNGDTVTVRTKQFSIADRSATAPMQMPKQGAKDKKNFPKKYWLKDFKNRKPEDYCVIEVIVLRGSRRESRLWIESIEDFPIVLNEFLFDSEEQARNYRVTPPVELKISSTVTLTPQTNE